MIGPQGTNRGDTFFAYHRMVVQTHGGGVLRVGGRSFLDGVQASIIKQYDVTCCAYGSRMTASREHT